MSAHCAVSMVAKTGVSPMCCQHGVNNQCQLSVLLTVGMTGASSMCCQHGGNDRY